MSTCVRRLERASDSRGLELQLVVSRHVGARDPTQSSVRATSAPHCRANSPAPASWFLYSRLWPAEENDAAIQAGSPHRCHGLSSRFTVRYRSLSSPQPPNSILYPRVCCPSERTSVDEPNTRTLYSSCSYSDGLGFSEVELVTGRRTFLGKPWKETEASWSGS